MHIISLDNQKSSCVHEIPHLQLKAPISALTASARTGSRHGAGKPTAGKSARTAASMTPLLTPGVDTPRDVITIIELAPIARLTNCGQYSDGYTL